MGLIIHDITPQRVVIRDKYEGLTPLPGTIAPANVRIGEFAMQGMQIGNWANALLLLKITPQSGTGMPTMELHPRPGQRIHLSNEDGMYIIEAMLDRTNYNDIAHGATLPSELSLIGDSLHELYIYNSRFAPKNKINISCRAQSIPLIRSAAWPNVGAPSTLTRANIVIPSDSYIGLIVDDSAAASMFDIAKGGVMIVPTGTAFPADRYIDRNIPMLPAGTVLTMTARNGTAAVIVKTNIDWMTIL